MANLNLELVERKRIDARALPVPRQNLVPRNIIRVTRFIRLVSVSKPDLAAALSKAPFNAQVQFVQDYEQAFGKVGVL